MQNNINFNNSLIQKIDNIEKITGEFDEIFNCVADNKRFCMKESIPNIGSQILSQIRKRAKKDWKDKYGNDLLAIVTTIGADKNGAVYLADNWKNIGQTAWRFPEEKSYRLSEPSYNHQPADTGTTEHQQTTLHSVNW